jgi:hypothetical protein
MNITIVDKSKGSEITDEIQSSIDNADWTVYITEDGVTHTVSNPMNSPVMTPPKIDFFHAVHRDVISGEKSAAAREQQLARLDDIKGEDPLKKAADVWKDSPDHPDFPGNHGPAKISGV